MGLKSRSDSPLWRVIHQEGPFKGIRDVLQPGRSGQQWWFWKTTNLNWLAAAGCLNHQHPSKTNTLFSTGETTALIPNDFIQKGFRIIIRDEETKNLKKWVNLMRGTILSLRFLQPNFPHPQEPSWKNPRSSFPFHRLEIGSPLSGWDLNWIWKRGWLGVDRKNICQPDFFFACLPSDGQLDISS